MDGSFIQRLLPLIRWPAGAPTLPQNVRRVLLLTIQSVFLLLIIGVVFGLSLGWFNGWSEGSSFGWNFGFDVGVTNLFIAIILGPEPETLRLAERLRWSIHHLFSLKHLLTSFFIGLGFLVFLVLSGNLMHSLTFVFYGGLSLGLGYWLFFGFYRGLVQNAVEDHDRRAFNQGIRRSLRNGALISCVTGFVITAMIVGGYASTYGPSHIPDNLLSDTWLLFLCGMLVVWAWLGGVTLLRHALIRLLLARSRTFPWRARAFLDDTTARILMRRSGGGYSFVHRRLLDYFARSVPEMVEGTRASVSEDVTGL